MRIIDLAMLFLFLVVFVDGPLLFLQGGRHRPANPELRECPACGAQNHRGEDRCYCCGRQFVSPRRDEAKIEVLQRVKDADDSREKRSHGTSR